MSLSNDFELTNQISPDTFRPLSSNATVAIRNDVTERTCMHESTAYCCAMTIACVRVFGYDIHDLQCCATVYITQITTQTAYTFSANNSA